MFLGKGIKIMFNNLIMFVEVRNYFKENYKKYKESKIYLL